MANIIVSADIKWTTKLKGGLQGHKEISQQHILDHVEIGEMTETNFKLLVLLTQIYLSLGDDFFD